DSNAAACTCAYSLCADRAVAAVAADWSGSGRLAYDDDSPREGTLPRVSPGRNARTFPSGAYSKPAKRAVIRQSIRPGQQDKLNQTAKETVLEMIERRIQ